MKILKLEIQNFRGYEKLAVNFEPGINVLIGKNGAGKTNLAEAISFLSLARSFRTSDEKEIRKHGESFARLRGKFEIGERKLSIEILLNSKGKKVLLNGSEIKVLSELVNECHVLVFKPGDAFLFEEAPSERRKFLNLEISRQSKKYLELIRKYEKALQERNALLKEENVDWIRINIITKMMIALSKDIVMLRNLFFEKIKPIVNRLSHELTGGSKKIEFKYLPFVEPNLEFEESAEKAFNKAKDNDLRQRVTTIGVHREDFSSYLNGVDISSSGSQGEKRLAGLILKLAVYEMVKDIDKKPILILDDVFSELDEERQERLLKLLGGYEQVIITATDLKNKRNTTVYKVVNHRVTKEDCLW